jgi:ketosteroid isomerase-like protein
MENSSVLDTGSIIDSASMLFGSKPQAPSRATTASQQLAMARRLEQLNAALGHAETRPEPTVAAPPPATASRRGVKASTVIVTAVVLAIAGGALMSLTATHDPLPNSPVAMLPVAAPAAALIAAKPAISEQKRVSDLLESWRSAWAQRDVAAYLDFYSPDFAPADGSPRDAWVAARTKKLSAGAPITLQLNQLALEQVDGDHFKATFLQDYAAGSYRETARPKTLLIARQNGNWRITREWQEETPLRK